MIKKKSSRVDYRVPFFIMSLLFTLAIPALAKKTFENDNRIRSFKEEYSLHRLQTYKDWNVKYEVILEKIGNIEKSIVRIDTKLLKG